MRKQPRRLIGRTFDGEPIFEPNPAASALVFAAMGGGKTTCVSVPAVQSLLADHEQALFLNDVKKGEIAHQIAEMCIKRGRRFGVVDDFEEMGSDYPHRISLNALGAAQAVQATAPEHLPLIVESTSHALIEEPASDQRNFYWRESPRWIIELAADILLSHNPRLATAGGLQALLADPDTWQSALENESEDQDSLLRPATLRLLAIQRDNPEHYSQHMNAALSALKIFSFGPLKEAGLDADLTHADLIRDKWVVCFVNPVRYADRLGPYFALHYLALINAQLTGGLGRCCLILDEFCNAPLREAVNRITIFRAFGLKCLYITQSRQDVVRKYGEREAAILEENCAVKQWLKFSNFEEAERVSRAMGETLSVSHGLGFNSDKDNFSGNFSIGKERLLTAYELMNLPDDEQILHITGLGFIHCRKVRQNEIAPYCHDLAANPLEGGRLKPDPKVTLDTSPWRAAP